MRGKDDPTRIRLLVQLPWDLGMEKGEGLGFQGGFCWEKELSLFFPEPGTGNVGPGFRVGQDETPEGTPGRKSHFQNSLGNRGMVGKYLGGPWLHLGYFRHFRVSAPQKEILSRGWRWEGPKDPFQPPFRNLNPNFPNSTQIPKVYAHKRGGEDSGADPQNQETPV